MMRSPRLVLTAALIAGLPAAARAQQTPSAVLSFLVTNQSVQTGDFTRDAAAAAATRDTITRALLVNLASTPIATSSSGFVYRLDPELGTMTRASDTFGTFYVERASTSGAGRLSLGASATAASYDRLDGMDLNAGTLVTTANQFKDEPAPFDTETLTLKIRMQTLTVFGMFGVTDRLEIGGALPLVQLHLEGSRVNVYRGQPFVQASGQSDASGIADAAIRGKYAIVAGQTAGLAVAGEVRLPTGNVDDLLGAGRSAVRIIVIGSAERGRAGVHGNAAIVRGGASNEFDTNGSLTVAVSQRVTAVGELLVRRLSDLHTIVAQTSPHPSIAGVETLRLVTGTETPLLSGLVTGVKWNAQGRLVISGQVMWRLSSGGLTSRAAPTVSVDYLF